MSIVSLFFTLAFAQGPAWESRLVVGLHQTGASSARAQQNIFTDMQVARPVTDRFTWWSNVRVASSPQQITVPAARWLEAARQVPVNEMARTAEFVTGLEVRLRRAAKGSVLGIPVFFGAQGSFAEPALEAQVYRAPAPASPQRAAFEGRFPGARSEYVALLPPDRERFYRFYGAGVRLRTEDGGSYMLTLGQDQSLSGGRYRGLAARFELMHPLGEGMHLFATVNLRVARSSGAGAGPPVVLEPAPAVPASDARVSVQTVASARDTYRIGIGVEVKQLVRKRTRAVSSMCRWLVARFRR